MGFILSIVQIKEYLAICGIVGIVGHNTSVIASDVFKLQKFITQALYCNAVRGQDSTGLFAVGEDSVDVLKKALPSPDFLLWSPTKRVFGNIGNYSALIGHNRAATRGQVTTANAHPFQRGPITLVHNGTLSAYGGIFSSMTKENVDSAKVAQALANDTTDPVNVLKELDGSYALVWHDARTGKMYAARNDERPLHFAYTLDHKYTLLASEHGMLRWLAARSGLTLTKNDTYYFNERQLYTLSVTKKGRVTWNGSEQYPAYVSAYKGNYGNGYPRHGYNDEAWGRHNRKKADNQTVPKSKSLSLAEKKLEDYKLVKGEAVEFFPKSWRPYPGSKSNDFGMWSGHIFKHWPNSKLPTTKISAVMHGVNKAYERKKISVLVSSTQTTQEYNKKTNTSTSKVVIVVAWSDTKPMIKHDNAVPLYPVDTPDGVVLKTKDQWEAELGVCVWCQGDIRAEDHKTVAYFQDASDVDGNTWPVCETCQKDPSKDEFLKSVNVAKE